MLLDLTSLSPWVHIVIINQTKVLTSVQCKKYLPLGHFVIHHKILKVFQTCRYNS